jgi:hypothetical protein
LITGVESTLPLRDHRPGRLAELAECLHRRTGGMIGSLSHLIRSAAIDAIIDGGEAIKRTHLDAIRIDHAAETHAATRPASPPESGPPG